METIDTAIGSYEYRLDNRRKDAVMAVLNGNYKDAQSALADCIAFEAVIAELKFQRNVMGADDER